MDTLGKTHTHAQTVGPNISVASADTQRVDRVELQRQRELLTEQVARLRRVRDIAEEDAEARLVTGPHYWGSYNRVLMTRGRQSSTVWQQYVDHSTENM